MDRLSTTPPAPGQEEALARFLESLMGERDPRIRSLLADAERRPDLLPLLKTALLVREGLRGPDVPPEWEEESRRRALSALRAEAGRRGLLPRREGFFARLLSRLRRR